MRLAPIPPAALDHVQRPLDAALRAGIATYLQGFVSERRDGALVGPFIPMLHAPQFGGPLWSLIEALSRDSVLPKGVREVAILVTGARFASRYELYAHEHVAARSGLGPDKIATIVAGERPADLTRQEGAAYDLAAALNRGGPLPEAAYRAATGCLTEAGTAELIFLTGTYGLVSMLLNAYDVSVPGREEGLGDSG